LGDHEVAGIRVVNNRTGKKREIAVKDFLLLSAISLTQIFSRVNWRWTRRVILK